MGRGFRRVLLILLTVSICFNFPINLVFSETTQNQKAVYSHTRTVERNSSGRIKRSKAAKQKFMEKTGHPHGWKGHEVDHKKPLYKGGSDTPRNMQWLTEKQHKKKHSVR